MWMSSYESDLGVRHKMGYETRLLMANERVENEMFIDYLKDNIKQLQDALDEIDEIVKERHNSMTKGV